jgi:hypothetical protein
MLSRIFGTLEVDDREALSLQRRCRVRKAMVSAQGQFAGLLV